MKFRLIFTASVVMVGILGLAISTHSQEDTASKYAEMVEEIEVMSRVIDRTLEDAFEKDYLRSTLFGRRGCQGFYLNGYGAVFLVNVQFAVADKQLKLVEREDSSDLWDRVRREVRRQPGKTDAEWTVRDREHDKEQIDQLKSVVASLVARYGSRMNHLKPSEKISIVVRGGTTGFVVDGPGLSGGTYGISQSTDGGRQTVAVSRRAEERPIDLTIEEPIRISGESITMSTGGKPHTWMLRSGDSLPASTLVLTFTKELLLDAAGISPQELLDRADVMQY